MSYKVTSPPGSEPIDLATAKAWLKVSTTADDDLITSLIQAAREYVETYLQIALINQTIQEKIDRFPAQRDYITLTVGNVISVTSVSYLKSDGSGSTPLALGTDVEADTHSLHARVYLKEGKSWGDVIGERNTVTITYTAGYADADSVPAKIKLAMQKYIADSYHGDGRQDPAKRYTGAVDMILNQIRQPAFWGYE